MSNSATGAFAAKAGVLANMSKSKRDFGPPRARNVSRAALLLGSALGVSIAVMTVGAPDRAWAANECGAVVSTPGQDTATCTPAGNTYPSGITYIEANPVDLSVILDTGVVVSTTTNTGVLAIGSTGFDASIYTEAGVSVTSSFNGLYARSDAGYASATNVGDVTAGLNGIVAFASTTGNATASNGGNVTVTSAVYNVNGMIAQANDGNAGVVNTGNVTVGGVSNSNRACARSLRAGPARASPPSTIPEL